MIRGGAARPPCPLAYPVKPVGKLLACRKLVKAVAYRIAQGRQAVRRERMGLEQQAGATVLGRQRPEILQHGGQTPGVIARPCRKYRADPVRLEFGILVEPARHDLGAISDQVLHQLVAALGLLAGDLSRAH